MGCSCGLIPDPIECKDGRFVFYSDYARLNADAERYRLASIRVDVGELHAQFNRALFDETVAENARLKAEVERLSKLEDYHHDVLNRYALDDMRLTAQVERLTKAALLVYLELDEFGQVSAKSVHELRDAAKEGKQS
jgi:hypothetical protein